MADYRIQRPSSPDEILGAAVDKIAPAYTKHAQEFLQSATPGQRLLLAWYFYWDDVTNGGHAQYFGNYTGDLWEYAMKACDAFGVPEAAILRDALALFPDGQPAKAQSERQEQLAEIDENKLEDLDVRFYDKPASDQEVLQYIEAHAKEFFAEDGPAGRNVPCDSNAARRPAGR
jgi:hypothetical protein